MQNRPSETRATLRERLGWTLLLVAVSGFGFMYIDARNAMFTDAGNALPLETRLDAYIPFVPEFVLAYYLYYPWLLLPLLVLKEREPYFRALLAFLIMQIVAGVTFVAFPSYMVRPEVIPPGMAGDLVRAIYRTDMGWNVFPSLHVAHSVLVALLFFKHARSAFAVISVAVGSALISASTVLIKQHWIVDVPAGIALAWFCFRLAQMPLPVAEPSRIAARNARALAWRDALFMRPPGSRRAGEKRDTLS